MINITPIQVSNDRYPISPYLQELISRWEDIQAELERVSRFESSSLDADEVHVQAIAELEHQLFGQELNVLQAIAEYRIQTLSDGLAKLQIWKRIVAPEGSRIERFTLPDQIALSALRDLESFS